MQSARVEARLSWPIQAGNECTDQRSWAVSEEIMGDSFYEDFLFYTVSAKMPIVNAMVTVSMEKPSRPRVVVTSLNVPPATNLAS